MKMLLAIAAVILALSRPAAAGENVFMVMQSSVTTPGGGARIAPQSGKVAFQARGVTTSGAGASTTVISASNDGDNYITIGTITLVLATATTSDGFTSESGWRFYRSSTTAISGTGASVSVYMAGRL